MFLLIAYTPIREYIPGYADIEARKKLNKLVYKADSLEYHLSVKEKYLNNLKNILTGNIHDSIQNYKKPEKIDETNIDLNSSSPEDSMLREQYKEVDPFELASATRVNTFSDISNYNFFTPVKGQITEGYNTQTGHYAVDIVAPANVGVKAVLNGIVVFADWTVNTGYVIIVQHENNLISVYKHNSVLLKKVGNFVQAGDVIAIIGESGELSTGPHLHFELWFNGSPLNPEEYIAF